MQPVQQFRRQILATRELASDFPKGPLRVHVARLADLCDHVAASLEASRDVPDLTAVFGFDRYIAAYRRRG